jgi:glutathione peroxidase
MPIYDFTVTNAEGNAVNLGDYRGKVLLVVNTATDCGFTPQYKGLQGLYDKYQTNGLEVLDFPCNQFGHQAPGSDEEIGIFCTSNYGTTFPRFKKVDVNGTNVDPLFTWLKEQKGGALGDNIKWNFTKFLINRNGDVIARFAPTKTPASIEKQLAALLEGK